ncbi:MAG: NAD+ synthase [Gammaproteobacteria bacterium]|nr:NAD+ synthase [Gammaproteobacteria bacterium]
MPSDLKIALIQENFLVGDNFGNTDKIIRLAQQQCELGMDLVVFPELAVTGYPPEDLLLRSTFLQQVEDCIEKIRQQVKAIDIVFGAPRSGVGDEAGLLFNSAFWLRDGDIIAVYDKKDLPNYAVFDEKRYFTEGSASTVVAINGHRFALLICEDIWRPEPAAEAVKAGAEQLLVLNASPFHRHKNQQRLAQIKLRVSETACPVYYLNMVGGQDELVFDGASFVINARQELVARLKSFQTDSLTLTLDANASLTTSYESETEQSDLASVYQALVLGVSDYVEKNGFKGVLMGLSGGVDSALTLAIAVDAVGADRTRAVMMPSRYTADMSFEDAKSEASALAVQYQVISIEQPFQAFLTTLQEPLLKGTAADTTEENIQARCRGIMLMAISNKTGYMLLTTGNKSEMAVGYATLYGDMSGGFAPLKDISKSLVYELCRYRNALSPVIPERVLTRPPSAELAPDQQDQDSLPPYDTIDAILEMSVEQDLPVATIVNQGYDLETVERIITMVQRNEYKRRQAAPGVRITRRAFGRDRRYPITSGYRRK